MFDLNALRLAAQTVYQTLAPTPQLAWPLLTQRLGCTVWVKHENHLPTGAFKVRGGLLYVQGLLAREPNTRGLVTATRGNHGQSLALAAGKKDPGPRDVPDTNAIASYLADGGRQ